MKNVSVYAFENDIGGVKTSFVNSLAVALNVSPSKISITKIVASGSRRLLALDEQNAMDLRIFVNIYETGKRFKTLSHSPKQKFMHFAIEKWNEQYSLKVIPQRFDTA
jgi:hypothetical protein